MKKFVFSLILMILGTVFLLFSINWLKEIVVSSNSELFLIELKYTFVPFLMALIGIGGFVFGLVLTLKEVFPKSQNKK